jgi:hypothetical protein
MIIEAGASCLSNGLADVLWRYRSSIEFNFERTKRVRNSVRQGRQRTYWSTFTNTLNAARCGKTGEGLIVESIDLLDQHPRLPEQLP